MKAIQFKCWPLGMSGIPPRDNNASATMGFAVSSAISHYLNDMGRR